MSNDVDARARPRGVDGPYAQQADSVDDGGKAPVPVEPAQRLRLKRPNLPLLMLAAREAVTSYFRPIFREAGLTEQQWRVLRALYDRGPLQIGQLAEQCQILGPSLTGVLNRMIETGLVDKHVDPKDARASLILLSPSGRQKVEAMIPLIEEQYAELQRRVGEGELSALYEMMHRIIEKTRR